MSPCAPEAEYLMRIWGAVAREKWHRLNLEGVPQNDPQRVFGIGADDWRKAQACGMKSIYGLTLVTSGL